MIKQNDLAWRKKNQKTRWVNAAISWACSIALTQQNKVLCKNPIVNCDWNKSSNRPIFIDLLFSIALTVTITLSLREPYISTIICLFLT